MKNWLIAAMAVFMLAACGDKDEPLTVEQQAEVIDDGTVGFEILGGNIEEATGVPKEEKQQIVSAFKEYIAAFNSKDIDRYMATVAKNPKGFDYEQDREEAMKIFAAYDIERIAEDITIVKYNEKETQVYANLTVEMVELETKTPLQSKGRQVTVFVKEDDAWKVSSVHGYIGEE